MNIVLVTDIIDFPNGTAGTMRVKMIGKALLESGCNFSIYTNTLKNNIFNNSASGIDEGIEFKYLHGTTSLDKIKLLKLFLFVKGIFALNRILSSKNKHIDIIYIYSHGSIFNLLTILLCKFYQLRIVQEINEWDTRENKKYLNTFISEGPMVKWSDAALVISKKIKEKVLSLNPDLKVYTLPVLEDPLKFEAHKVDYTTHNNYCFWMGQVDGYLNDILLIIKSCSLAYKNGYHFSFVIAGEYSENSLDEITKTASHHGYPISNINLLGYLDEKELLCYCKCAYFYIVPLWNNQKSFYRFPTKLSTFLFCGKPIITCKVGDVGDLLTDNFNVLFYEPGDIQDLNHQITKLFDDSSLYINLCINSKYFANNILNYGKYSKSLHDFFTSVISN